jgi:hypothetical protein
MPSPDLQVLEEQYRSMSEEQLMQLAHRYDEFTDDVQALVRSEFERRSLEPPLMEDSFITTSPPLVTVGQYRDATEAFVARAMLESEGICCFLQDENMVRMDWLWSNLIGGLRLKVAAEDEARALEMLSSPMPDTFSVEGDGEYAQPVCPKCGSIEVVLHDGMLKPAATVLLVMGTPLLPNVAHDEVWRCLKCGCLWREDEEGESA